MSDEQIDRRLSESEVAYAPRGAAVSVVLTGISIAGLAGEAPEPMQISLKLSDEAKAIARADDSFENAANYVLRKNAELYRRLA